MAIEHADLLNLGHRTNVMIRLWQGKTVIIYDDHRWLLNVLFYLRKRGLLLNPNLVFFDAHDDAVECRSKDDMLKQIGVTSLDDATEEQFISFVDYDLNPLDDNWLSVACELDMIGDATCIGNRNNDNIKGRSGVFDSTSGTNHHVYELSINIDLETSSKGSLGDGTKPQEFKGIRSFFNTNIPFNGIGLMQPYILDVDLDCFTLEVTNGPNVAWSPKIYENKFPIYSRGERFIRKLLNDAELITICREPDFCGSIGNSNYILELLDANWFDGALGASTNY